MQKQLLNQLKAKKHDNSPIIAEMKEGKEMYFRMPDGTLQRMTVKKINYNTVWCYNHTTGRTMRRKGLIFRESEKYFIEKYKGGYIPNNIAAKAYKNNLLKKFVLFKKTMIIKAILANPKKSLQALFGTEDILELMEKKRYAAKNS